MSASRSKKTSSTTQKSTANSSNKSKSNSRPNSKSSSAQKSKSKSSSNQKSRTSSATQKSTSRSVNPTTTNIQGAQDVKDSIDVFAEFDKLSGDLKKTSVQRDDLNKTSAPKKDLKKTSVYKADDLEKADTSEKSDTSEKANAITPLQKRRATRSERLAEEQSESVTHNITRKATAAFAALALTVGKLKRAKKPKEAKKVRKPKTVVEVIEVNDVESLMASDNVETSKPTTTTKPKKKKKYRLNKLTLLKRLVLLIFSLVFVACIGVTVFVLSVLQDAADINPHNIHDFLPQNSVMFDIHGNVIDDIFDTQDGRRTNITYSDLPPHLVNAFIAIEDRTFREHRGFNFVRMVGAVLEAFQGDGRIQGTSTITQQLARNIYLQETRLERTLDRKILEAYYAFLIERYLTKEQIMEAYLNTIQMGFNASGVQAAAQAYFGIDASELNLLQSAALAALPQAPSRYALIRRVPNEAVEDDNENIIVRGPAFTLLYNYEASTHRRNLVLALMREQELITEMEFRVARNSSLRHLINPRLEDTAETTSYFADFARQQVIEALMEEFNLTAEQAWHRLNHHGLRIHTTLDPRIQNIIETEFENSANFPAVRFSAMRNSAGNIVGPNRNVLFYSYHNFFDSEGNFTLRPDEFERLPDGSLKIFRGNRLRFFRTEVQGQVDYSVEFPSLFIVDNNIFYSIDGGFIAIPRQYKTRDTEGNLILSASFFVDRPTFFTETDAGGLAIGSGSFSLNQRVIQPQSAMVVTDHRTGHIKAMVGGRNIVGRLLFNRADSPRPPGSSIKPIGVYGPALQSAVDALNGHNVQFTTPIEERTFGNFWTAASAINDAPMYVNGTRWPRNWYHSFRGFSSMRTALEESRNVPAVKVFNEIGPYIAANFMQRIGVSTLVTEGRVNDMNPAALALGGMTHGISPLEMTSAFGTFINQGIYVAPTAFTRIYTAGGDILIDRTPRASHAMDPGVAFIMADMLRTNVVSGTNREAAIGAQPVGGKTGTTNERFDIWFAGFTPYLSATIWIGNDVNIPLSQGSYAASRLWSRIMRQVNEGTPTGRFPERPDNVISVAVDAFTGGLPGGGGTRSEFFVRGTQPTATLSLALFLGEEVSVEVCVVSGHLATPSCSQTIWATGFRVPRFFCFVHNPDPYEFPVDVDRPWTFDLDGLVLGSEPPRDDSEPSDYYNGDEFPGDDSDPFDPEQPGQSQPGPDRDPDCLDTPRHPGHPGHPDFPCESDDPGGNVIDDDDENDDPFDNIFMPTLTENYNDLPEFLRD